MIRLLILSLTAYLFCYANVTAQTKLLRFPTVGKDKIAFIHAGDLYVTARSGGKAQKLTHQAGYESFPRFSPDGNTIAFTGNYDGNTEVYTIPSTGGVPKRLTYTPTLDRDDVSDRMGPNNIVMTWRDNQHIVYRTRGFTFVDFKGLLMTANVNGGLSEQLPFSVGGFCSYSPDKNKLAYNRIFREFRTWKYYKGGMADDIYIYDFNTEKSINITNTSAQDFAPMWIGNKVYYVSDRDRTANIFCYDVSTGQTKKVTNFTEYDVKFPSGNGEDAIVFENGGEIYLLSTANDQAVKINIQVEDDFIHSREVTADASKNIQSFDLSPDAKRMTIAARGDVFSIPVKEGVTRNLSRTSNSHERGVNWSPDGKTIAFISDRSGEDEIYIQDAEGNTPAVQLTDTRDVYKYGMSWSPDSKKILWSDKKLRLRYVEVDSRRITEVDQAESWEFNQFSWSPDSKWITYTRPEWQAKTRVCLYNVASQKRTYVTDQWYGSGNPIFSADGKYLYLSSERDFSPIYSATEWNHAYRDMDQLYLIPLSKDTPNPFRVLNDEVKADADSVKKDRKKDIESAGKNITVDLDGIMERMVALPVESASYFNLQPTTDKIYYLRRNFGEKGTSLMLFDLESKKETKVGTCDGFELSRNLKKAVVSVKGKYYVIDAPNNKLDLDESLDFSGLKVKVNKTEEWKQIYNEAWRQMRDFFYDPNMHGVDWAKIKEKYGVLLPHAHHRTDLSYLIGEMIGELNCGHAYVNNGDAPQPDKIYLGLLGAEYSQDPSGYVKIRKIIPGGNWSEQYRSPLTEAGVNVKEGDYLIAVNGVSLRDVKDFNELLTGTAEKVTELTVNASPSPNGARKVYVKPLKNEADLRYFAWVRANIQKVSQATNDQIGYIHVPDMSAEGLNEFVKYFYPQLNKKGLIIDVRHNGGGNVSPMIIERLRRELDMVLMSRNVRPTTSPAQTALGPKVALLDQYTASDGDLFSYRFKYNKLGTLIGVRSWGGTVGIRGSLPFVDGGTLSKPEFSRYDVAGQEWIIEGYGVDPDIEVRNDPHLEFLGKDEQLDKAIEVILQQMKQTRTELPPIPQFPRR